MVQEKDNLNEELMLMSRKHGSVENEVRCFDRVLPNTSLITMTAINWMNISIVCIAYSFYTPTLLICFLKFKNYFNYKSFEHYLSFQEI